MSDPWAEFVAPPQPAAQADPWAEFARPAAPQQVAPATRTSRFLTGVADYAHGGAQLLANALPSGVVQGVNDATAWVNRQPVIGPVTQALGMTPATPQQLNTQVQQREAEYEASRRAELQQPEGELPTDWLRIGGRAAPAIAAALATRNPQTLRGAVGMGVAQGAGQGALEPVAAPEDQYWESVRRNTILGAGFGAAGGAAGYGVGRVMQGVQAAREGVRELRNAGVQLTPGQIMGGYAQRVEDSLGSVPILGAQIRAAQHRGVESFNRAVANRVLAPIGQTVDEAAPVGRDLISDVAQRIGAAYDNAIPRIQPFMPDQQFMADLSQIATRRLTPDGAQQFQGIIQNNLLGRTNGAAMDGATFRAVDSDIGSFIRDLTRGAPNAESLQLANALRDTQTALRSLLERTNPAIAPELRAANQAFANYVRFERAAAGVGATDGVFTPAQLNNAVQGADSSARHGAFARGDALLQDMSDPARAIMPRTVPDSGTPERAALMAALLGAGGGGAAMGVPLPAIAAGASGYAAYTEPGRRMIQYLLAGQRPASVAAAGRALAPAGGAATVPLGSLLLSPPPAP